MSKKQKKPFVSLTTQLLIAMAAALAVAMAVFFSFREFGNFLVWKYYLTEDAKKERVEAVISDLREYVKDNMLSVNDTEMLSDWSAGRYVYVVIYKDTNLIYAPEWFQDFEDEESDSQAVRESETGSESGEITEESSAESDGVTDEELSSELTDESVEDSEYTSDDGENAENSELLDEMVSESVGEDMTEKEKFDFSDKDWFSGDRSFEKYLTEEAREKYGAALDSILEGNAELSPIYCVDGTLLATVVDYSEDFMYDLVFAIGLICAVLVVGLIMFASLSRLTSRVKRLAAEVRLVEKGDINTPLRVSGNDEIADLANDVNSMRNAVVDNMTKGQQAWEANAGLITAMSHDIRTPLTVMLGYLDLIELQEKDEANREYISICKENALRLKSMSDDMFSYFLAFGKNEIELDIVDCNAADTVGGMIAEYEILLSENQYVVQRSGEIPSKTISVDTVALGRVIGNIFSNVTKYASEDQPVLILANENEGFLNITVENAVRAHTDNAESTGIGVKTSARIIDQMGGGFAVRKGNGKYAVDIKIPFKS